MKDIKHKVNLTEKGKLMKERIKNGKFLVWGVLLGIVGSILANILNDFVKGNFLYPCWYVILIIALFLFIVYYLLREYFFILGFIYKHKKILKKYQKLVDKNPLIGLRPLKKRY